jgi:glycosyltransferase involved in cell wall biosynthesis
MIPIFRVFARIPIMFRICVKERIDLIIGYHLTSYGFAGSIVSRLLKLPVSVHFLGKDIDVLCRLPIIGTMLIRYAKTIDALTVQGTKSKSYLNKKKIENIYIIPTACDIKRFIPKRNFKEYDLIFLGRLSKEKRVDRFVEIVNVLKNENYPIKALIVGSGPYEKKMLHLISNFGLNDCIHYLGWKDDVTKYLSLTKIFVLTSDNDQLPSSLLEAMAMGLVPVISNVGNLSDIVDLKNIIDLKGNCNKRFANRIIELLTDKTLYDQQSKQSIKKARKFSIEANSARWEYVIENLKEKVK